MSCVLLPASFQWLTNKQSIHGMARLPKKLNRMFIHSFRERAYLRSSYSSFPCSTLSCCLSQTFSSPSSSFVLSFSFLTCVCPLVSFHNSSILNDYNKVKNLKSILEWKVCSLCNTVYLRMTSPEVYRWSKIGVLTTLGPKLMVGPWPVLLKYFSILK